MDAMMPTQTSKDSLEAAPDRQSPTDHTSHL